MTRQHARTRPFGSAIALLTALLLTVLGGVALPAAALSGDPGQEP